MNAELRAQPNQFEEIEIKWQFPSQPSNSIRMVFEIVTGVWVDQRGKRPAITFDPVEYGNIRWRAKMAFDHARWVRPYRPFVNFDELK